MGAVGRAGSVEHLHFCRRGNYDAARSFALRVALVSTRKDAEPYQKQVLAPLKDALGKPSPRNRSARLNAFRIASLVKTKLSVGTF